MNLIQRLTPQEFMQSYKLLIADADGTIRRCTVPNQPCPNNSEEWELIPEAQAWLNQINWDKHGLGIASNQGGISLGYLSKIDAYDMLLEMITQCIQRWPPIGAIQVCSSLDKDDPFRKPNPGMLREIMKIYRVGPHQTLYVGDMESDMEAARNACVDFIWASDLFGFEKS